jgi:hypothetical protein
MFPLKQRRFTYIFLFFEGLVDYARLKPSIKLNRVMYILMVVPIGFVLWLISWLLVVKVVYPRAGQDLAAVILSLIVCFDIEALIDDFIGRLRHYKGPGQYQPLDFSELCRLVFSLLGMIYSLLQLHFISSPALQDSLKSFPSLKEQKEKN